MWLQDRDQTRYSVLLGSGKAAIVASWQLMVGNTAGCLNETQRLNGNFLQINCEQKSESFVRADWHLGNCYPRNTKEPGHRVAKCVPS